MLHLVKHKTYLWAPPLYLGKKYDFISVANERLVWSRDVNVSDSSILGYPRAPAFIVSSNSHFGTPRLDSYSFGQPEESMLGCKGKESTHHPFSRSLVLESQHLALIRKETYKDKRQEESRFKDYQLGDKGEQEEIVWRVFSKYFQIEYVGMNLAKKLLNAMVREGEAEVEEAIVWFYEHSFKEDIRWRRKFWGALVFNLIGEGVREWLERAVEEEEVRDSCLGDKTPSPDGFLFALFQQCWRIVKCELLVTIAEFRI
ncbi:hypothetical protein MTR67_005861 [Solanum verrucosum]|uniref:Uncharacterized protein n=1 Tax=Solanum verrucosum TaxID=315347 RepID=A0AAF0Q1Y4_SOLVR|nr:hypothetical protein MTR67_005861 [Solanum verrucosum]